MLIELVIWIIIVGLVFYLLFWLVGYIGLPAPFDKVARVVLALVAVLLILQKLLPLAHISLP